MCLLGLLEFALLPISQLLTTDFRVLMRTLDHHTLLFLFGELALGDDLLVSESLVFNLHGLVLVLFLDEASRDNTVFPFGFDATSLEGDGLLPFLNEIFSFLCKRRGTLLSYLFSMKLLCLTSIIFWYLFLAISFICLFLFRSTYR